MDLTLSEDQRLLRESARRFLADNHSFERRRTRLGDAAAGRDIWAQFAGMGWLGMNLPESADGLGASAVETTLLTQELGRALVVEPYIDGVVLAGSLLQAAPEGAMRDDLLRALGIGAVRIAVALHEPGARYDFASGAVRVRNTGASCLISGAKVLVTGGAEADFAIVSAIPPHGQVSELGLFLVTLDAATCQRRAYRTVDNFETADLLFNDAPAIDLVADPAQARAALGEALDQASVAILAEAVGCMEAVIALTAEHLRTRKQFGQTLGTFQALQHRIAEMHVECEYAKAMIYKALESLTLPAADREMGVSAAKIRVCQAGLEVGAQGIQLHGAIGMTEDHAVGHYYRRLLAIEKTYGDLAYHFGRFEALTIGRAA